MRNKTQTLKHEEDKAVSSLVECSGHKTSISSLPQNRLYLLMTSQYLLQICDKCGDFERKKL